MLTEAEIEYTRLQDGKALAQVNRLLEMLNPVDGPCAIELDILGPNGLELFNIGALQAALEAQCASSSASTEAEHHMFSDIENHLQNHELIRKHYRFNSKARICHLTYTWAKRDERHAITDETHQVEYHSDKVPDNYLWKQIINGVVNNIGSRSYLHLYHHDFEFIYTRQGNTIHYTLNPAVDLER